MVVVGGLEGDAREHVLHCFENDPSHGSGVGDEFRQVEDAGYGQTCALGADGLD